MYSIKNWWVNPWWLSWASLILVLKMPSDGEFTTFCGKQFQRWMVSGKNVPLNSVVCVLGMMNRLLCPLVGVLRTRDGVKCSFPAWHAVLCNSNSNNYNYCNVSNVDMTFFWYRYIGGIISWKINISVCTQGRNSNFKACGHGLT